MVIHLQNCPAIWIGGVKPERMLKMKNLCKKLKYNDIFIQAIISNKPAFGNRKSTELALKTTLTFNKPTIVFEDDANTTKYYKPQIEVPDDTDAVWLGTSIMGLVDNWYSLSLHDQIFVKEPTILKEYKEFYKVENMLSAHAILFVSLRYKQAMYNYLKYCINDVTAPDVIFAATMKNFNIYACKRPMFFQDDNAHNYLPTITPLTNIFKK